MVRTKQTARGNNQLPAEKLELDSFSPEIIAQIMGKLRASDRRELAQASPTVYRMCSTTTTGKGRAKRTVPPQAGVLGNVAITIRDSEAVLEHDTMNEPDFHEPFARDDSHWTCRVFTARDELDPLEDEDHEGVLDFLESLEAVKRRMNAFGIVSIACCVFGDCSNSFRSTVNIRLRKFLLRLRDVPFEGELQLIGLDFDDNSMRQGEVLDEMDESEDEDRPRKKSPSPSSLPPTWTEVFEALAPKCKLTLDPGSGRHNSISEFLTQTKAPLYGLAHTVGREKLARAITSGVARLLFPYRLESVAPLTNLQELSLRIRSVEPGVLPKLLTSVAKHKGIERLRLWMEYTTNPFFGVPSAVEFPAVTSLTLQCEGTVAEGLMETFPFERFPNVRALRIDIRRDFREQSPAVKSTLPMHGLTELDNLESLHLNNYYTHRPEVSGFQWNYVLFPYLDGERPSISLTLVSSGVLSPLRCEEVIVSCNEPAHLVRLSVAAEDVEIQPAGAKDARKLEFSRHSIGIKKNSFPQRNHQAYLARFENCPALESEPETNTGRRAFYYNMH